MGNYLPAEGAFVLVCKFKVPNPSSIFFCYFLSFSFVCLRMLEGYGRQHLGVEVFASKCTKPHMPDITPHQRSVYYIFTLQLSLSLLSGFSQTNFDQMFITICFMWILTSQSSEKQLMVTNMQTGQGITISGPK